MFKSAAGARIGFALASETDRHSGQAELFRHFRRSASLGDCARRRTEGVERRTENLVDRIPGCHEDIAASKGRQMADLAKRRGEMMERHRRERESLAPAKS